MMEYPVLENAALLLKANIMRYDHFTCNPDLADVMSSRLRGAANVLGDTKNGLVSKIQGGYNVKAKDVAALEEILHTSMIYIERFTKVDSNTRCIIGNGPETKFESFANRFDRIMGDIISKFGLDSQRLNFPESTEQVEVIAGMRDVRSSCTLHFVFASSCVQQCGFNALVLSYFAIVFCCCL
jgi:hypothetical protein